MDYSLLLIIETNPEWIDAWIQRKETVKSRKSDSNSSVIAGAP